MNPFVKFLLIKFKHNFVVQSVSISKNTEQIYINIADIKQKQKGCTQKSRSCTVVIRKGDHDTVHARQRTKEQTAFLLLTKTKS